MNASDAKKISKQLKRLIKMDKQNPYGYKSRTTTEDEFGNSEWDISPDGIQAYSQPMPETERNRLPEGERIKVWRKFWTIDQVVLGARVSYKGDWFEITGAGFEDWETYIKFNGVLVK